MFTFETPIPVTISPAFLIVAILIGFLNSGTVLGTAVWLGVIVVSILVHELGHALTARMFRQHSQIHLWGFGGLTQRTGPKLKLWQEFLVVLNGPMAGFFLAMVAAVLFFKSADNTLWKDTLRIAVYVNAFWNVLNLIPIYPLDGGHLLGITFQAIFGFRGIQWAYLFSLVLGISLAFSLFIFGLFLPGAIVFMLSFESFRAWSASRTMSRHDHDESKQKLFEKAQNLILQGNNHQALELLEQVRSSTGKGVIYNTATEYQARLLLDLGETEHAYEFLHSIKDNLSIDGQILFHKVCFKVKKYEEVIPLENEVFQNRPSFRVAEINALSHAALGNSEAALGWLQRAQREGSPIRPILELPELDPIRHDPRFREWVDKIK